MGMGSLVGEAVDRIGGEPISSRMARRAPLKHLDPVLLLTTISLAIFGIVMVFTATASKQTEAGLDPATFLKRQLVYVLLGSVALAAVSFVDYRHLKGLAPIVYGVTLLALVVVLTPLGYVSKGASRWINLGSFQAQPSELAKIAVIVTLAAFLAERKGDVGALAVAVCCALVIPPAALIYLEPDLGTMMVFAVLTAALLLVGGGKIRHFVSLASLALIGILVVLQMGLLQDYQLQRITSFLEEDPDVQSEAYNLTQATIAIASGGARGKGLDIHTDREALQGARTQTALDFVPEQHTDFIFTAIGEQLGFVGSATLLGLFALLIWRALRIAGMSRDLFGTLIATGVAGLWAFQMFVNVGMTMGIMPITGIPLPFISYGGSSLITNFVAVGLLLNVHMRRFL
ncbi:MAG: rod shape-determining protein RodA [Actinomycetota bacterium]